MKKLVAGFIVILSLLNSTAILAAAKKEIPYGKFFSGFGLEDPDPDMDGIYSDKDKCPVTSFDIWVGTVDTKKQPAIIPFQDPKNAAGTVYLKVKKINDVVTVQTSADQKFSKGAKSYSLKKRTIILLDGIGKRVKVLFSNSKSGTVVFWTALPEGKTPGCDIGETPRK
ncbi:MAG: hypothetical protein AAB588_01625 [Patescibacteria group bacterium]